MRKLFKKFTAATLALTLAVGMTGVVSAAVAKGTDVSNGKSWSSFSVHGNNAEDGGKWEADLIKAGQFYDVNVTEASGKDSHKAYGEDAKISAQTSSSFTMDVVSTGWSAQWHPQTGACLASNPWGVTATKVVNVERGRYYTIDFKIKSTLKNELTEEKKRSNGTYYNVGTGKFNYIKHIHFKAYDDKDADGAALTLTDLKATIGGVNVLEKGNKDFDSFVKLDSQNTADDGWVTVSAKVLIPSEKADYQSKAANPTLGIKFAFGAFLKEYKDENNMSGKIEVKDFTVKADDVVAKPAKVKGLKLTAKKKAVAIKFKKASKAKKYEVTYSLKSNFKGAKTKTTSKTKITIKKLKSKKKYYVKVRGFYTLDGKKVYGAYSGKKSVKIK